MLSAESNKMLRKTLSQDSSFDSNFYKDRLDWTGKFINESLSIIESNYSRFPTRNRWNCNCHAIHDNDYDALMIDYSFLRKEYTKVCKKFCSKNGYELVGLSDIWYNYYKTGQYQEPHNHLGKVSINQMRPEFKLFTAVHYMIFDNEHHSVTQFCDPNIIVPKVDWADIIFFPATWMHYVTENTSNFPRLTTAFTFQVRK